MRYFGLRAHIVDFTGATGAHPSAVFSRLPDGRARHDGVQCDLCDW